MRVVLAHVRWEWTETWRRLSAHPLTLVGALLGLPAILAAYGACGHVVASALLEARLEGSDTLAELLRRVVRAFAVILLLMGSGGVVGNLFNARPRAMLARYRQLPLSDREIWCTRKLAEDGIFLALFIVPMALVIGGRLLSGGMELVPTLIIAGAPIVLCVALISGVRAVVLALVSSLPGGIFSWRPALIALLLAVSLGLRPGAEFARWLWLQAGHGVLPLTDWVAGAVAAWLEGDTRLMASWLGVGLAVVLALLWIDLVSFRSLVLRRFDRLMQHLSKGRPNRIDPVAWLCDRLPTSFAGAPLRGPVRVCLLRVMRDPVLSLALLVPALVVALAMAMSEVALSGAFDGQPLPLDLGSFTSSVSLGFLGLVVLVGSITAASLLIPGEGAGLGALATTPHSARDLARGHARAATALAVPAWLLVYFGALLMAGPSELPTWVAWGAGPIAVALCATVGARAALAVGAVFARPTAQNPLLRAGLLGLWLSYLFATLASATALVALAAPYLLGRELVLFALPATLFWTLALSLLAREAARAMASERTQTRLHNG